MMRSILRHGQPVLTRISPNAGSGRWIKPRTRNPGGEVDPGPGPSFGPNLVLNGGFDTDVTGWEGTDGTRTWVPGGKIHIEPTSNRVVLQNTEATNGPVGGGVYEPGEYEFRLLGVDNQLGVGLSLDIYDQDWEDLYVNNPITLTDTIIPMTFIAPHAGLIIYLYTTSASAINFIEIDAIEVRAKR